MYERQVVNKLEYNPEDGLFRYKERTKNRYGIVMPGDVAGTKIAHGYIQIASCGKSVRAHRLAFLFMTGKMPDSDMEVDHIDGDRTNNRWSNLRLASRLENAKNITTYKNKSGVKGVYWFGRQNEWRASIRSDKIDYFLGGYKTKEEAIKARREAEIKYHGNWARGAALPTTSDMG